MGASGARGGVSITVTGLREAVRALRDIDRALPSELKRGIRRDAEPILAEARGHASALGGSGQYAASLAMRTISDGVRIASSDPGAGTIEFAHRGAVYLSGRRAGLPAGVPGGSPPRALVRAAIDNESLVASRVEGRIEALIERYLHG